MTHQEQDYALHSYSCACKLGAHQCAEHRAKALEQRKRDEEGNHGMPPAHKASLLQKHDEAIAEHERMYAVHSRRADYADQGFMISSPDESTDTEHQRKYGPLQAALQGSGRLHVVGDRARIGEGDAPTVEDMKDAIRPTASTRP
jgi:hypothetical protein